MSHLRTMDQIRARFKNVSSGGPKLRVRIDLPNVPLELLEQAQSDDDLSIVRARRRALFESFGLNPSADTKQEAEKLVSAIAAKMFPALRQRSKEFPKRPGRPPAYRPKHEVNFLKEVAEAYDNTKNKVKNYRTAPPSHIYKIFLKENPILANKLKVQGRPLQLSSFNKLLAVGRSARNYYVTWYKDALSDLPDDAKKSREYLIMRLAGRAIHLGILRFRADSQLTCSTILVRADARC